MCASIAQAEEVADASNSSSSNTSELFKDRTSIVRAWVAETTTVTFKGSAELLARSDSAEYTAAARRGTVVEFSPAGVT